MPKNIVLLSDGTGQSYSSTPSNVFRLYEFALNDAVQQIAFYSPGIGASPRPLGRHVGKHIRHLLELGFGLGLMEDVAKLYIVLMLQYQPGDAVFLFGFSRGAFTVRALAALLHLCGLLRQDFFHLVPQALDIFQTSDSRIAASRKFSLENREGGPIDHGVFDCEAVAFKSAFSQSCRINFMGIWDTVKAYGFFRPRSFPCLRHNPSVLRVRHAVSLDERRSHFQMTGWGDRDDRTANVKEVWFVGDHSDVGGGHDDGNSQLSDIALIWMLGEATNGHPGLLLNRTKQAQIEATASRSSSVPLPNARNLDKGGQWWISRCPRPELDNNFYPPRRPWTFRPSAAREPGNHSEKSYLRYHETVPPNIPLPGIATMEATLPVNWIDSKASNGLLD